MFELRRAWFLVLFILFSCSLYAQDYPERIDLPKPLKERSYPKRIISLGPATTDVLYLLDAEDRIIANTVYCKAPQGKPEKEKIGTVIKVNLEKIIKLKPDLVLATSLTDKQQLKIMKGLRIKVIEIPLAGNFNEICKNFLQVGQLIGKGMNAEEIIKESEAKIDSIRKQTAGLSKQKALVQIGAQPLFVATKEYFINDFIGWAGGINIAADLKSGLYSREEALKQDPDVIIISTMGSMIGEEEKKEWQRFKSMKAVKNNRIYVVESEKLCAPTPKSFVDTLKEISIFLHPETKFKFTNE